MKSVNIHDAKTSLSALIAAAEAGEEVVISRANKPVVRLVPIAPPRALRRTFGLNKDKPFYVAPDFDAPLPDDFWLGREPE